MGDEFKYIPVFCAAFMLTFAVARALVWSRVGKADRMQKWMFSSSTASFCHGSVTATMAFLQLRANYPFLGKMDAPNSPEQELLLQISTGYMLSDSFYMIFFDPDLLFILHHIITIVYMTWCISIGQGALSCLLLMFMGEITSPFQNVWLLARDLRFDYPLARVVFRALTPLYTVFFVVVRTFVGPVYVRPPALGAAHDFRSRPHPPGGARAAFAKDLSRADLAGNRRGGRELS
mmetsp:Transcript_46481/g.149120  ORF Transcript_46481/g.149120 Transcript_46481/m.149120 type:complete len:234 (-) Transcript_46481:73-774(-)